MSNRRPLTLIFLTLFLDLLGVGILIPITPYLVRQYRSDALTIGLLVLIFSAAQFFMTPVLGALSDRYGRRPVLLVSLFGTAVGHFMFGLAPSLAFMFAARALDGITGGNISAAQAYVADITPPEDRAKSFGLIGAAFGLGFMMGPAIGGLLSTISLQAPAYAAGTLALVTTLLSYFFLPESLPVERRVKTPLAWSVLNPFRAIGSALGRVNIRLLLLATFFLNFAYSALQSHFAIYTLTRYGLDERQNSMLLTYLGVMITIIQGGLIRRLMPVFGESKLARAGLALGAVGFLALIFSPAASYVYGALTLLSVGSGLAAPAMQSLVSQRAGGNEQGEIMGVVQSLGSLSRILGPLWAGFTFDAFSPTAPYWTGFGMMVVSLVLVLWFIQRKPELN
ncbi:MAG: MFS transporter [Bryobacteraceae bacterium]|nr:MFS transporter [Bryobacteraceae bacterium]